MARRNRTARNSGIDAKKNTDPALELDHVNQNAAGQEGGPHVGLEDGEPNVDSELSETSGPRCTGMSADTAADDIPELCDQLSLVPLKHPFAGPLLKAAQAVLEIFDGDLGINDENSLPVIEARRILYGADDGFVAAHTASEAKRLIRLGKIAANDDTQDGDIFGRTVPLSRIETELGAGLRLLGQLALNGRELPISGQVIKAKGGSVACSNDPVSLANVVAPQQAPVPALSSVTGTEVIALSGPEIRRKVGIQESANHTIYCSWITKLWRRKSASHTHCRRRRMDAREP